MYVIFKIIVISQQRYIQEQLLLLLPLEICNQPLRVTTRISPLKIWWASCFRYVYKFLPRYITEENYSYLFDLLLCQWGRMRLLYGWSKEHHSADYWGLPLSTTSEGMPLRRSRSAILLARKTKHTNRCIHQKDIHCLGFVLMNDLARCYTWVLFMTWRYSTTYRSSSSILPNCLTETPN